MARGEAVEVWKNADCVCFDFDSTVCMEEGIDVLAEFCGAGEEVSQLTRTAMEGGMKYEESLAARLKLMNPSLKLVQQMLQASPPQPSPHVAELINTLKANGKHVYFVSGGFRQIIEPTAAALGVPRENVFANNLIFDDSEDGNYVGFDTNEPTAYSGGKPKVVSLLMEQHGFKNVVMVGDGATDMEARPPAALFVGFGGVVVREPVKAGADWFVTDFTELIEPLENKMSVEEVVAVFVTVEIKPDRVEDFKAVMAIDVEGSRKEDGCLRFDLLKGEGENVYNFYEMYKNQACMDSHKKTDHYGAWAKFKESGGVVSQSVAKTTGSNVAM